MADRADLASPAGAEGTWERETRRDPFRFMLSQLLTRYERSTNRQTRKTLQRSSEEYDMQLVAFYAMPVISYD